MIKNQINVLLLLCLIGGVSSLIGQNRMQLKDYDGNHVAFFLLSNDKKVRLLSDDSGKLELVRLKQNESKKFTLHFTESMAYLLYHTHLYFENGNNVKDSHIDHEKVTYKQVKKDSDKVFFLRRIEAKFDDIKKDRDKKRSDKKKGDDTKKDRE